MTRHVFKAQGVFKKFRKVTALDGLDLELERGAVTVLLGPNGAGKTTLMQLALGTLKPDQGSLQVMGFDPLKNPREVRQATGYVPTLPDAYPWMTLNDFFRLLRPQYPNWDEAYAQEVIKQLAVPTNTRFKAMSRGQGMRAMLVAALAPKPGLLLLDEPFSGLDPLSREEVLRGVISRIRDEGRTVLCATHDLNVASRLADRVVIIANGRVQREGSLEEVLECEEPARVPDRILDVMRDVVEVPQEVR